MFTRRRIRLLLIEDGHRTERRVDLYKGGLVLAYHMPRRRKIPLARIDSGMEHLETKSDELSLIPAARSSSNNSQQSSR